MFNSTKVPSKILEGLVSVFFTGISSLIKRRMSPPWESISYLNRRAYPSMIICDCEKEESIFISKTIGMSMFTSITLDNASNLSLMELMFKCFIVYNKFKFSKKLNRLQFGDEAFYWTRSFTHIDNRTSYIVISTGSCLFLV